MSIVYAIDKTNFSQLSMKAQKLKNKSNKKNHNKNNTLSIVFCAQNPKKNNENMAERFCTRSSR